MRSQIVTASPIKVNLRYKAHAFTELGVAMLSSVLKSPEAVQVNISIMRTFFRLRALVHSESKLSKRVDEIEKNSSVLFKVVFDKIEKLERTTPLLAPNRRKIGI